MFKFGISESNSGFSLFEVIVSILMASTFVAIGMQTLVLASFLRVRAQEKAEATLWVQDDMETIKSAGKTYAITTLSANGALNDATISVSNASDFSTGSTIKLAGNPAIYTVNSISGNTLAIAPGLAQAHDASNPAENSVSATQRCNASIASAGWASGFRDKIQPSNPTSTFSSTKNFSASNKTYHIYRDMAIRNQAPFNVLELRYQVVEEGKTVNTTNNPNSAGVPHASDPDDRQIAQTYAEIIPNVALQCP
jgi:type II secretory pathway pseudopilin PulG